MTSLRQLPRLGDREGLRIDATRGAVTMYRLAVAALDRVPVSSIDLGEAERDLISDVREAYVTSSIDRMMTVRYRNRARAIDVIASLTRLAPDHVRVDDVQVRNVKSTNRNSGRAGLVRRIPGAGSVRLADGEVEWRDHGSEEWRPASLDALARDHAADHDVWIWLARHGIRRPGQKDQT